MDLSRLDDPFLPGDIEWRIQRAGKSGENIWAKVLAYVTNRAIMKRLDEVCGKSGWRNEYRDIPNNGGVECGISIKVDGEWITKWDAAENTQVEAVKGGRSGAMKRAAVQWGIGRYLYSLEEGFATVSKERLNGYNYAKTKELGAFYWSPPPLPSWAMPSSPSSNAETETSENTADFLEEALREFAEKATLSQSVKELQAAFKEAWAKFGGSKEHEERATETYKTRGKELKTQTA
ncbi:recombinase [Superficieibacter electus]|uniref:Recombinase n=1 Tax=Superficieibacter electus TaxID=2022662 RepID=A0A2P5GST4_9ENTR|nr:Rad52/Rad22 family DNA repair protein [Superficieibacter electus]POP46888.1 recombinase [Superficieibacter electus]POP49625.1 recombinase [Superficieibacter electus]